MGKAAYFVIGAALGAAAALVGDFFLGPARNTTFDRHYQSRLDWALAQGEHAADESEARLRRQFELAKAGRSRLTPS